MSTNVTTMDLPLVSHDQGERVAIALEQIAAMMAGSAVTPASFESLKLIVQLGLGPSVLPVGTKIPVYKETSVTATPGASATGITAATVDADKFIEKMGESAEGEYEFTFNGSVWHLGDSTVPHELSEYGIAVTGTPAANDTLIVVEHATVLNFVVRHHVKNGGYGSIRFKDKAKKNGIILETDDVPYYGVCFDSPEALYYAAEALPAGTYHFGKGTHDSAYAPETSYQFTLTQQVPAGGVIVLTWNYNTQITAGNIKTYPDVTSTTAIETCTITAGTGGTDLGDASLSMRDGNINHISCARYGYNGWYQSFIRQFMNASGAKATYFAPQNKWDRKPAMADSTDGLLHGVDPAFVSIIAECEVDTHMNSVTDATAAEITAGNAYRTTVDRMFLLSRSEHYGGKENNSDNGLPLDYYSANSDLASAGAGDDTNRIKLQGSTARYYWERTPTPAYAYNARGVNPSGTISLNHAYIGYGCVPACMIG